MGWEQQRRRRGLCRGLAGTCWKPLPLPADFLLLAGAGEGVSFRLQVFPKVREQGRGRRA